MAHCWRQIVLAAAALPMTVAFAGAQKPHPPTTVTIERPVAKRRTVTGGICQILSTGTFAASFAPDKLPTLGFTIGPKATMAAEMHANLKPFSGPGTYKNVIVAVYLGKTALVESYGGLGTVTMNGDGHTGTFTTNDGKAAGHFDCGAVPVVPRS
jgi:hypothetical protein